jgi:hypothetical protein
MRRIVRIKVDKLPWSQAYNVLHLCWVEVSVCRR